VTDDDDALPLPAQRIHLLGLLDVLSELGYDTGNERLRLDAAFGHDDVLACVATAALVQRVVAQYWRETVTGFCDPSQDTERLDQVTGAGVAVAGQWDSTHTRTPMARAFLAACETQYASRATGLVNLAANGGHADPLDPSDDGDGSNPDLLANATHLCAVVTANLASLLTVDTAGLDRPAVPGHDERATDLISGALAALGRASRTIIAYAYPRGLIHRPDDDDERAVG
jgi:hypothetical protein